MPLIVMVRYLENKVQEADVKWQEIEKNKKYKTTYDWKIQAIKQKKL